MKQNSLAYSWMVVGSVVLICGVLLFFMELRVNNSLMDVMQWDYGYPIGVAGLALIAISVLFLDLDQEPEENKESPEQE